MAPSLKYSPMTPLGSSALPDCVLRQMLPLFAPEELLALEQADPQWRRAMQAAGQWQTLTLRRERDEQRVNGLLRSVAGVHGHELRRLHLVDCAVSNELLINVAGSFHGLQELVVSGCKTLSDEAFAALVSASRHSLIEIRAVKCPMLTDEALRVISHTQAKSLKRIDVSHCRLISSDGIATLVHQASSIESIGMKGCPKINDAAVVAVASSCNLSLRSLAAGGAGNLTDVSLTALADHCQHLESLDIARSNPFGMGRGGGVTDQGLEYLWSKCCELQHLVLRGHGRLSLSVLASLSVHCAQLRTLDIGGCRGFVENPALLCAELKRMSFLQQLSVAFCRDLQRESIVRSLAADCPQLKCVQVDGQALAPAAVGS